MLMSCPECSARFNLAAHQLLPLLHRCSGHGGMLLPMVQDGIKAHVTVVEREDYIGRERPMMHEGRPIMAVTTTRDDGEDRVIFAPTAQGGGR